MKTTIHVASDRCKGCCLCIAVCQAGVLEKPSEPNRLGAAPVVGGTENCINCGMCEMVCPEFAIWVRVEKNVMSDA